MSSLAIKATLSVFRWAFTSSSETLCILPAGGTFHSPYQASNQASGMVSATRHRETFVLLTPVRFDGSIATGDHWRSTLRKLRCSQTTRRCHSTSYRAGHTIRWQRNVKMIVMDSYNPTVVCFSMIDLFETRLSFYTTKTCA